MMYIDTQVDSTALRKQLDSLKPIPGTCIFIDMCNSYRIKTKGFT